VARVYFSGWARIGIVASVIWFFLFGGYFFVTWSLEVSASSQRELEICYRALTFKLQSDKPGDESELEKCIAESGGRIISAEDLVSLLLMDLGTIIFGWVAVLSAISFTRWTKKDLA
jgi:hypothetical protein